MVAVAVVVVVTMLLSVDRCEGAIGDSRLRISITNSMPAVVDMGGPAAGGRWADFGGTVFTPSSAMHHGATVRLYDPVTDLTYHQSSDPRLVEALGKMWNPRFHPEKCGAYTRYQSISQTSTASSGKPSKAIQPRESYICDPDNYLMPNPDRIIHAVPMTTGCQCDSLRHCNQYSSGFTVYVAVVPFAMEKGKNKGPVASNKTNEVAKPKTTAKPAAASSSLASSSTASPTTPAATLVQKALGLGALIKGKLVPTVQLPFVDMKQTDLIISRDMSGRYHEIVPESADIYDLLALYLRASWATGECDEDVVICFFPKERKLSLSVGGRLFDKMTAPCLNTLVAETMAKLATVSAKFSTTDDSQSSTPAVPAYFNQSVKGDSRYVIPNTKRPLSSGPSNKERKTLTPIFHEFVNKLNDLIQSRQNNPCAVEKVTRWSQIDILGVAVLAGIGLSVTVAVFLRVCNVFWLFFDKYYDEPTHISAMFKRGAERMMHSKSTSNNNIVAAKGRRSSSKGILKKSQSGRLIEAPSISIVDTDFGLLQAVQSINQSGNGAANKEAEVRPTNVKTIMTSCSDVDNDSDNTLAMRPKNSVIYIGGMATESSTNFEEGIYNVYNDIKPSDDSSLADDSTLTASGMQCEKDSLEDETLKTETIVIGTQQTSTMMVRSPSNFRPSQRPTAV